MGAGGAREIEAEQRFTADELTSAMDGLHALSMATWRELLALISEYDRAEAWRADGMTSMADWLIARYGLARPTANEWVRTSRALRELPAPAEAVSSGRLSIDQARWAIRLATPETDAAVAADAPSRSAAELHDRVRQSRVPTADDANEADRRRSFRWRDAPDGRSVRLAGEVPVDAGAALAAALTRMAEQAGPDPVSGLYDPFDSRCADALVELASARLAADADADPGDRGRARPGRVVRPRRRRRRADRRIARLRDPARSRDAAPARVRRARAVGRRGRRRRRHGPHRGGAHRPCTGCGASSGAATAAVDGADAGVRVGCTPITSSGSRTVARR